MLPELEPLPEPELEPASLTDAATPESPCGMQPMTPSRAAPDAPLAPMQTVPVGQPGSPAALEQSLICDDPEQLV